MEERNRIETLDLYSLKPSTDIPFNKKMLLKRIFLNVNAYKLKKDLSRVSKNPVVLNFLKEIIELEKKYGSKVSEEEIIEMIDRTPIDWDIHSETSEVVLKSK